MTGKMQIRAPTPRWVVSEGYYPGRASPRTNKRVRREDPTHNTAAASIMVGNTYTLSSG